MRSISRSWNHGSIISPRWNTEWMLCQNPG